MGQLMERVGHAFRRTALWLASRVPAGHSDGTVNPRCAPALDSRIEASHSSCSANTTRTRSTLREPMVGTFTACLASAAFLRSKRSPNRTPMAIWRDGVPARLGEGTMDMTLRLLRQMSALDCRALVDRNQREPSIHRQWALLG
jgi:hypothetical protein